jgi:hypothetical protein
MDSNLKQHTSVLIQRLEDEAPIAEPSGQDTPSLLKKFHATPVERSPLWLIINRWVLVRLLSLIILGYAIYQGAHYFGFLPSASLEEMGDARLAEDYRAHQITDWAFIDDRNIALSSTGGGVHHSRLDGGTIGFWETFDPVRTRESLAETEISRIQYDGHRLWIMGERGSLSSCNRKFKDWTLHFGAGGFVPNMDISKEMTCLLPSVDQSFFVVGTRENGIGVYDVTTRQWLNFSPELDHIGKAHVTSLLLNDELLWVGCKKGLNVFRLWRERGDLHLLSIPRWDLPRKFSGRPVELLSLIKTSRGAKVQCLIGRGAHLEADLTAGAWTQIVDEGDEQLTGLNGNSLITSVVPTSEGAWLGIQGYGRAFYDKNSRRLSLLEEGLPTEDVHSSSSLILESSHFVDAEPGIWTLTASEGGVFRWDPSLLFTEEDILEPTLLLERLKSGKPPLFAYILESFTEKNRSLLNDHEKGTDPSEDLKRSLVNELNRLIERPDLFNEDRFKSVALSRDIYGMIDNGLHDENLARFNRHLLEAVFPESLLKRPRWRRISLPEDHVDEFQITPRGTLIRTAKGVVKLIPPDMENSPYTLTLFESGDFEPQFGAAAVGSRQLFIGVPASENSNKTIARYLPATRSFQSIESDNPIPFTRLRADENVLWGVKGNGEVGFFSPLTELSPPKYQSLFGPSDLPCGSGIITTAEAFHNDFWFVRKGPDDHSGLYEYHSATRTIHDRSDVLGDRMTPKQLRATRDTLYVWGDQNEHGSIYYRSNNEPWSLFGDTHTDMDQMTVTTDAMVARSGDGEVFVQQGTGKATSLLKGTAPALWRKLLRGRFDLIWGIDQKGRAAYYHRMTGSWVELCSSANDIVVVAERSRDMVYVGTMDGMRTWEVSADSVVQEVKPDQETMEKDGKKKEEPAIYREKILSLDFDGQRILALSAHQYDKDQALWIRNISTDEWQMIWWTDRISAAPASTDWASSIWVDFVGDELWFVTKTGDFFRYGLQMPRWLRLKIGENNLQMVQLSHSGVLWSLDGHNNLYCLKPSDQQRKEETKNEIVPFIGTPEYRSWLETLIQWTPILLKVVLILGVLFLIILPILSGIVTLTVKGPNSLNRFSEISSPAIIVRRLFLKGVIFFLIACTLITSVHWICRWKIDNYQPFIGKNFKGKVLGFRLEGDRLTVLTSEGKWRFRHNERNVTPISFLPGANESLTPPSRIYPRLDKTGLWQIRFDDSSFNLLRKNIDGFFNACPFGDAGLKDDELWHVGVIGERLIASTPAGLVEYHLEENHPQFHRITPLENVASGLITRERAALYYAFPDGLCYLFDPAKSTPWVRASSPWPRSIEVGPIRWQDTPWKDQLDSGVFSASSGRFLSDICTRVMKDANDEIWLQTVEGWRHMEIKDGKPLLAKPVLIPPKKATIRKQWKSTDTWKCLRTSKSDTADSVKFIFTPSTNNDLVQDPFEIRARWPDEDALSVLPDGEVVWIGTARGLRRRDSDGGGTIFLAGLRIEDIARWEASLFCRTNNGDFVLQKNKWKKIEHSPPGTFPAERKLEIPLGPGVKVKAIESTSENRVHTTLSDFDSEQRRFYSDVVEEVAYDGESLLTSTLKGIQRVELLGDRIGKHRADLTNYCGLTMRRGTDGKLYTTINGQSSWRCAENADWVPVVINDPSNPFTKPPRVALSDIVTWERRFSLKADSNHLWAGNAPIEFINGKLSPDYITGMSAHGLKSWQATPTCVIQSELNSQGEIENSIIQWPKKGDWIHTPKIAEDNGNLVCLVKDHPLAYAPHLHTWRPSNTTAFHLRLAEFNSREWNLQHITVDKPQIVWDDLGSFELNDRGQFPFDSVQSVASNGNTLWIITEAGLSIYSGPQKRSESFKSNWSSSKWPEMDKGWSSALSTDYKGQVWLLLNGPRFKVALMGLQEAPVRIGLSENDMVFRLPTAKEAHLTPFLNPIQWSGVVRETAITVKTGDKQDIMEIIWNPNHVQQLPLRQPVIDLIERGRTIWVLTSNGLYKLGIRAMHSSTTANISSLPSEEDYWCRHIQLYKESAESWDELGYLLEQIDTAPTELNPLIGTINQIYSPPKPRLLNQAKLHLTLCNTDVTNFWSLRGFRG